MAYVAEKAIQGEQRKNKCGTHNPKVGGSNPPPATKILKSKAFTGYQAHFPKTISDHFGDGFRIPVLQDHRNHLIVGLPLAVRHRPAVNIHRGLNAGMAH